MKKQDYITIALIGALSVFAYAAKGALGQESQPSSESPHSSFRDSANELSVLVGKTVLVDCAKPIRRVALGLGDIAEVSAVSRTEIVVSGKSPGETSLTLWDITGGRQFFNVTVRAGRSGSDGLESVRRELKTEFPGQDLRVTTNNGVVYLRGTAKDLTSAHRALQIASGAGKIVNLLNVTVPTSDPQILLKVRFAAVDRTKAKEMGINIFNLGLGNAVGGISTGQFSPPTIGQGTGSSNSLSTAAGYLATFSNQLNILAFLPGRNLGADLQLLETKGVVETLAEPNLLATNGKQASFLAGGEYPYPVVQSTATGPASVTIMFKEYGVRLNFIPTITPRGSIRLQVAPEVSALDFTNAVQISGFNVPAISTRKVNTEVELSFGQTFIIGGLLDNRETQTFEKVPFIGDIPILGKLFQSISKNRTNTELIVMVTPEIVSALPAGAPLPDLEFPEPFLPPNSPIPMHQPVATTQENAPPPMSTLPMEKLIESMQPETPLVVDSTGAGFGGASPSASGPAQAPASPPQ